MSTIVVLIEISAGQPKKASLEAVGAARAAGGDVVAVALGSETYSPDAAAQALAALVKDRGAKAFVASATSTGRDLAPRVAALVDSTLFSDCTGLQADGDSFTVTRPWLAGKVIATLRSRAPVLCATLRRNVFEAASDAGSLETLDGAGIADGKATLTGVAAKEGGKLDVSEAPIVVSGGRGLKEAEHFKLIEDLASAFGNAGVGASRAVVDAGWRPHSEQVGQTGKTVSPQLYVAVGISGAIQHLAGMKTSKVIVAINKDADAPIFKVADYGLVGDAFEVLPALTEEIKKVRAEG